MDLIPFTYKQIRKAEVRNDKTGQKLATKVKNRRKNRLARKNRRLNLRRGNVAGRQ